MDRAERLAQKFALELADLHKTRLGTPHADWLPDMSITRINQMISLSPGVSTWASGRMARLLLSFWKFGPNLGTKTALRRFIKME